MKREYIKPIAMEELFLANSYVAKCQTPITQVVTSTPMRCINPRHGDYGDEFSSVWVDGRETNCKVKVAVNATKTVVTSQGNYFPAKNALVYGEEGIYECTDTYWRLFDLSTHNVPDFVNSQSGGGPCYGSYVDAGKVEEHFSSEVVFS